MENTLGEPSDVKAAKAYRDDMKDGQVRCLGYDGEEPGKLVRCVIFSAIEADGVHSAALFAAMRKLG